jgi:hypothetical protein
MQGFDIIGGDEDFRPRRAVAVVLGEVQHCRATRHLQVLGAAWLGLELPLDAKSEPIAVELLGKRSVENP